MSDIFREVDEALQQEKMERFWHEYKETIVLCIIIVIVGTAAMAGYRSWDSGRDGEETARLLTKLESGEEDIVLNDTRGGIGALSRMLAASQAVQNDNTAEAAALYRGIVEDGAPEELESLARVLAAHYGDQNETDILIPVASNEESPWTWHARLQAAAIAAQNGDYGRAIGFLESFEETQQMAPSLKQRAQAMRHVYSLQMADIAPAEGEAQ
jgi:hypothetical protein